MGWLDRLWGKNTNKGLKPESGQTAPPTPARETGAGTNQGTSQPAAPPPAAHGRGPTEEEDAKLVEQALRHIQEKQLEQARQVLLGVVGRAPANYVTSYEVEGKLHVKFWDMASFVAYVAWMKSAGQDRDLVWVSNAYPRAYYYLGYIQIEAGDLPGAVRYLEEGIRLEPTSARLKCEKGQALIRLSRQREALTVYQEVLDMQGFLSPADRALALRGRGYVLIEMDQLDQAEQAFQASLTIEPESSVARNELAYIAQQRRRRGAASTALTSMVPKPGTAGNLPAELGITQEQFDIWYQSYQFALQMSSKSSNWNDDIDTMAREVGALTEAQIAAARTDFQQAVLNRIRLRVAMERRRG
jgi:tetratricopeptide (TPR) repeat protein